MYERVDIIFVVSRPMVGVVLYVVQVLDHMAEDTRLTIVIEAAGVIVIIIMTKSTDDKDLQNEINKKTWQQGTERLRGGKPATGFGLSHFPSSLFESQMRQGNRQP